MPPGIMRAVSDEGTGCQLLTSARRRSNSPVAYRPIW
jgi:hypothetical protein